MRITEAQARLLKEGVREYLPQASVYLFGSRADDAKRGGDIDVLVIGERPLEPVESGRVKAKFYERFGEQKMDIVSFAEGEHTAFRDLIESEAVPL